MLSISLNMIDLLKWGYLKERFSVPLDSLDCRNVENWYFFVLMNAKSKTETRVVELKSVDSSNLKDVNISYFRVYVLKNLQK